MTRRNGEAVAASLKQEGGKAIFQRADVSVEDDCRALIARAVQSYGRIDVLVNNAAISLRGNLETTSTGLWDQLFCHQRARRVYLHARSGQSHETAATGINY